MKKIKEKIWIGLFVVLLGVPFLLNLFMIDNSKATVEKPSIHSEDGIIFIESVESFPSIYESYYNDVMPLRKQLVYINNTLDYRIFHVSSNPNVVLGNNDWLFYSASSSNEDPLRQSLGYYQLTDEQLQYAADNMSNLKEKFDLLDIEFYILIAPNKESIYTEEIPDYYHRVNDKSSSQQLIEYIQSNTDVSITYPLEDMREYVLDHQDVYLYHKLDTHWNSAGAYIGAYALTEDIGISMPTIEELTLEPVLSDIGDLVNMLGITFPKIDEDYMLSDYPKSFTTEELSSDGQIITYQLNDGDSRSVFMIRDSYGKALGPIFASSFKDTTVVFKYAFDQQYLFEYKPDIFVLEAVERYAYDEMAGFNISLIQNNVKTEGDTTYVNFKVIDPSIEDDIFIVLYWKGCDDNDFQEIGDLGHQYGEYSLDYPAISHGTVKVCIYTDEARLEMIDETYIDY